jgi:microcystin-dependent protein
MAGQKISLLPPANVLLPTDQIVVARSGVTLRLPGEALITKSQFTKLQSDLSFKAPLLSAEDLYTRCFQISSAAATWSYLSILTAFNDRTFLSNLSAQNTFIFNPISDAPKKSGDLLTWNGSEWTNGLGITAVINQLSGVKTLDITPVGALVLRASPIVPFGYFLCNGGSYSKLTYPDLFAVIGYTFGGSGNNFSVPNIAAVNGVYSYIKYTEVTGIEATSKFVTKADAAAFQTRAEAAALNATFIQKPAASEGQVLTYVGGQWVARSSSGGGGPAPGGVKTIDGRFYEGYDLENPTYIGVPDVEHFELHCNGFKMGEIIPGYDYTNFLTTGTPIKVRMPSFPGSNGTALNSIQRGALDIAFFTEGTENPLVLSRAINWAELPRSSGYTANASFPGQKMLSNTILRLQVLKSVGKFGTTSSIQTNLIGSSINIIFKRTSLLGYTVEINGYIPSTSYPDIRDKGTSFSLAGFIKTNFRVNNIGLATRNSSAQLTQYMVGDVSLMA